MHKNVSYESIQIDEATLSRISWLYFVEGLTQSEVAKELGMTRLRINKALGLARSTGMIQIVIRSPFVATFEQEKQIVEKYGLKAARIGLVSDDSEDHYRVAGTALAYYLNDLLATTKIKRLGVSWGMTLEYATRYLDDFHDSNIEVVSLMGGLSKGTSINTFGIASKFAQKLGSSYHIFAAPLYADSKTAAKSLMGSAHVMEQLEKVESTDVAILAASDMSTKSVLIRDGLPKDVKISDMKAAGAVGDILGRFLDAQGNLVKHEINHRAISPSLDSLKEFEHSLLVAAGAHKTEIIHAILKAGLVNTLITDSKTGTLLLSDK